MNLLIDTNTFYESSKKSGWDENLTLFINWLIKAKDCQRFTILLDVDGEIEKEYYYHMNLVDPFARSGDPLIAFGEFLAKSKYIKRCSTQGLEYDTNLFLMKNKNFHNEDFEVRLLFLAKKEMTAILCPKSVIEEKPILRVPRIYAENFRVFKNDAIKFLSLNNMVTQVQVSEYRHPSTMNELQCILDALRTKLIIQEGADYLEYELSEEREAIEFKGVSSCLTQGQLDRSVKAICGMLNSCESGWVFIGVDKNGQIVPFTPKYEGSKTKGVDHIINVVCEAIERIEPSPYKYVRTWAILNEDREKVVIVNYVKKSEENYLFNNNRYIRHGNRTPIDKNWLREQNEQ